MRKRDKVRQLAMGLGMAALIYVAVLVQSIRGRYDENHTS